MTSLRLLAWGSFAAAVIWAVIAVTDPRLWTILPAAIWTFNAVCFGLASRER